jgi:hypothetical protein
VLGSEFELEGFFFRSVRTFFVGFFTLRLFWGYRRGRRQAIPDYLVSPFLAFFSFFRLVLAARQGVALFTRLERWRRGELECGSNLVVYDQDSSPFPSEALSKIGHLGKLRRSQGLLINTSFWNSRRTVLQGFLRTGNVVGTVGFWGGGDFPLFGAPGDVRSEFGLVQLFLSFARACDDSWRDGFHALYVRRLLQFCWLYRGARRYSGSSTLLVRSRRGLASRLVGPLRIAVRACLGTAMRRRRRLLRARYRDLRFLLGHRQFRRSAIARLGSRQGLRTFISRSGDDDGFPSKKIA